MLCNQDEAHEERQAIPAQEAVSRNAHGESLDDARETFRVEWEARLRKKKQRSAQARQTVEWIGETRKYVLISGLALGAYFGGLIGAMYMNSSGILAGLVLGGPSGTIAVIPLLLLCRSGEWFYRQRAEQLEYEVGEMERG